MSGQYESQEEYEAAMQEEAAYEAEMQAQQAEAEAAAEQARIESEGVIPDDQNIPLMREKIAELTARIQELERERDVFRGKYIDQVQAVIKFFRDSGATGEAHGVQRALDEFLASLTQSQEEER